MYSSGDISITKASLAGRQASRSYSAFPLLKKKLRSALRTPLVIKTLLSTLAVHFLIQVSKLAQLSLNFVVKLELRQWWTTSALKRGGKQVGHDPLTAFF